MNGFALLEWVCVLGILSILSLGTLSMHTFLSDLEQDQFFFEAFQFFHFMRQYSVTNHQDALFKLDKQYFVFYIDSIKNYRLRVPDSLLCISSRPHLGFTSLGRIKYGLTSM